MSPHHFTLLSDDILQEIFRFLIGDFHSKTITIGWWKNFIQNSNENLTIPSLDNLLVMKNLVNCCGIRFQGYSTFWRNALIAADKQLHILLNGYNQKSMDHVHDGDLVGYEKNMMVRVGKLVLWKEIGIERSLKELIGKDELFDYPEIDQVLNETLVDLEEFIEQKFNFLNCVDQDEDDLFTKWLVKSYQLLVNSKQSIDQACDFVLKIGLNGHESNVNHVNEDILILDISFNEMQELNTVFPNVRLLILRSEVQFMDDVIDVKLLDHVNRTYFPKLEHLELLNFPFFSVEKIVNSGIIHGLDSLRLDLSDDNYLEDGSADLSSLLKQIPKKSLIVDFCDIPEPQPVIQFYSLSSKHKIYTSISSKMVDRRYKRRW